jgi:hypothetical protein
VASPYRRVAGEGGGGGGDGRRRAGAGGRRAGARDVGDREAGGGERGRRDGGDADARADGSLDGGDDAGGRSEVENVEMDRGRRCCCGGCSGGSGDGDCVQPATGNRQPATSIRQSASGNPPQVRSRRLQWGHPAQCRSRCDFDIAHCTLRIALFRQRHRCRRSAPVRRSAFGVLRSASGVRRWALPAPVSEPESARSSSCRRSRSC